VTLLTAGFLTLAAQLAAAAPHDAPARQRRGPIESRDEFLLAQPRLTLPATTPDALGRGRTVVRLGGDWGNDFGLHRARIGGEQRLAYLVDGEHRSGTLQVSRGLSDRWTVHARVPVLWRGGGVLDGLIDTWHRITGLPDGGRPSFARGRLVVVAVDTELRSLRWSGRQGTGVGGVELGARWSGAPRASGWTAALDARVQLPAGTGAFAGGGMQAGIQAVAARTLGGAADVYLGAGGVAAGGSALDGIEYGSLRPQGFLALEWRPWGRVSLLAEATVAGRLVENIDTFPGLHVNLRIGAKVDVARAWRLDGGFVEGLHPVSATTDFGILLGVARRF
jgi:hypothetical protein